MSENVNVNENVKRIGLTPLGLAEVLVEIVAWAGRGFYLPSSPPNNSAEIATTRTRLPQMAHGALLLGPRRRCVLVEDDNNHTSWGSAEMRRTWEAAAALVTGLFVSACGENAFLTGVQSEVGDVTGSWTYHARGVAGGGLSCDITGVTINLTQTNSTFTGTVVGGYLKCIQGGQIVIDDPLADDVIANGRISGATVSFDIGAPDVHHSGAIAGNSMTGQITIRADSGTAATLTGPYSMVR